jgi:hypothetical protein
VRPDVPLAAIDRCFLEHPVARTAALVAEAWTDHPAGRWVYACALNVSRHEQRLEEEVDLVALGAAAPTGPVACWDWSAGTAARLDPTDRWSIALDPLEWDLRVLAPILPSELAVIGDPTRYATAGDTRIAAVEARHDGVRFTVLGASELVMIVGWAASSPRGAKRWTAASGWSDLDIAYEAEVWRLQVPVPATGWVVVEVSAAGA